MGKHGAPMKKAPKRAIREKDGAEVLIDPSNGQFLPKPENEQYCEAKKRLGETNKVVKKPISRIDAGMTRRGNKKKYSPTRMANMINKYFKWCEDEDEIPSTKGMMIHLKMSRDMFYIYAKYPEYTDIMDHARMIMTNWIENDIYNTQGLAAGKIGWAKNNLGWADKLETSNTSTVTTISTEEARLKIESLAPMLLELLKNSNLVNQLSPPINITPEKE